MTRIVSTAVAIAATIMLAASPVLADTVTSTVKEWDPAKSQLVIQGGEVFLVESTDVVIPENLTAGDQVTIEYESAEGDVMVIQSITKLN